MAARKPKGPNGGNADKARGESASALRRRSDGRVSVGAGRPREARANARKNVRAIAPREREETRRERKGALLGAPAAKRVERSAASAAAERSRRGAPRTRERRAPEPRPTKVEARASAPLFVPKRIGPFVVEKLRALDAELEATIPRVLGEADGEAIHDMRVAIRRLRTILKVARPVFGRFHADAVRQAFTHVHRATSALRDEEVLEETLEHVRIPEATFLAWQRRRKLREQRLRREVRSLLEGGELDRARRLLTSLLALPIKPGRDKDLLKFARGAVDAAREIVERDKDVPLEDAEGLHALRIRFKHLRYTTEIFAEALPPALAGLAKTAAQFQKRLGEIHDLDVALDTVRLARGLTQGARAAVLTALGASRETAIDKFAAMRAAGGKPPSEGGGRG